MKLSTSSLKFLGISCVLIAGVTSAVIAFVVWKDHNHAAGMEASLDAFPADLPEALRQEISIRQNRLRQNSTAEGWGALGELCAAHKLMPQAGSCFRTASSLAPDDPKWVYQLAVMAEKVDLSQAIALYDKVLSLDDSVAAVHYHRGRALARIGRFDDAEQSLKTAGEMTQQHPLVLKAMAQLRMMQGNREAAVVLITQALSDSRAGLDIVEEARRLSIQQSAKNLSGTSTIQTAQPSAPQLTEPLPEPWMEGVFSRRPTTKEVGIRAGALASNQQFSAALVMYERLMKMQNRNSRAHTAHAMVLMNAGNAKQALEEMKLVCEKFPNDALTFSSRGTIEAHLEDYPAAVKSFQEAVRLKPDFVDAHRALLLIYQFEGQEDRIDAQFKTLLSLVPGDQELRDQYAKFQSGRGAQSK